jgi:hypothetical protein
MMVNAKLEGLVTHEMLGNTMPFYCCWLVDKDDESKPCIASVSVASSLYTSQAFAMVPPKVWIN